MTHCLDFPIIRTLSQIKPFTVESTQPPSVPYNNTKQRDAVMEDAHGHPDLGDALSSRNASPYQTSPFFTNMAIAGTREIVPSPKSVPRDSSLPQEAFIRDK